MPLPFIASELLTVATEVLAPDAVNLLNQELADSGDIDVALQSAIAKVDSVLPPAVQAPALRFFTALEKILLHFGQTAVTRVLGAGTPPAPASAN